ncbi:hypothetical protein [Escherichia coli]|uniref:hypothetical protein n=1 Tax=Escherichia coli TaxID=562 RepID=UPI00157327A8|nr:hypothetical protein [Escherichia coli]QKN03703.1 hypothetical protein HPE48_24475 [Escherichia coli]
MKITAPAILAWKTAEPGLDGKIRQPHLQPRSSVLMVLSEYSGYAALATQRIHITTSTIAIIEMRTEKFKQFRLSKGDKSYQPMFPLK